MHVKPRPRHEPIKVMFDNKTFEITFDSDGAHVPEALGRHMIAQGLAVPGDQPNPKPRFEHLPGGAHGRPLGMFDPWCREVN
jgi:hypothetical protein